MRNLLSIFVLLFSVMMFSQVDNSKKPKMNFYFNPSLNVGLNLIKEKQIPNNTQYIQQEAKRKFTYGMNAVAGYNFIPNFALGTGLKYNFIEDNYHLIYWMIQPKIIFNPGDQPFYIDLNYGKQINKSAVSDSEFWGVRLGIQVSYSKRLSQEGGIVFEGYKLGNNNPFFIGLSYGITIFSNKNYTIEGID